MITKCIIFFDDCFGRISNVPLFLYPLLQKYVKKELTVLASCGYGVVESCIKSPYHFTAIFFYFKFLSLFYIDCRCVCFSYLFCKSSTTSRNLPPQGQYIYPYHTLSVSGNCIRSKWFCAVSCGQHWLYMWECLKPPVSPVLNW